MTKLNLALFGCGDFLRWQSDDLKKSTAIQVAALFDPDQARAQKFADQLGGEVIAHSEDIFADPSIDVVAIFVPPWVRKGLFLKAAAAGKHVIATKPLGSTSAECAEMRAAAEKAGIKAGILYSRSSDPWFEAVKDLFLKGRFGQLALYKQDWIHPYPQWNNWATDPEKNGGPFMDAMIHNLNAACYLMDKPVEKTAFFSDSKPTKDEAERVAALFKKFGLNSLRHHKHLDGPGWQGFQSPGSFTAFEPEGLARFDYFNKCLREAGVFLKLSPTFGVRFGRDDLARIPYHAEIGQLGPKPDARVRAPFGMVYLSTELQDLQIEQTVNLLNHTNPHTGLRYADDPAVYCVEFFNEDSVLFSGTNGSLAQSPTLRARVASQFSAWLKNKYKTEDAWRAAWGEAQVIADPAAIRFDHLKNLVAPDKVVGPLPPESLAAGTVVPWASPWFNDAALNPGGPVAPLRARLLDSITFLITLQDAFYDRFATAVRATGFKGEFVASNWQAGSLAGHLLNLHSDARTGLVDRHNYFGGAGNAGIKIGQNFKAGSMLTRPGMGSLSAGFQQVDGAAFMLSEWTHVQPNEWYAEGPAIMGAYGWGLQGWDVSYIFQMGGGKGGFTNRIGANLWDATNPVILATFPTVARMVRRFDVTEAPVTHTLNAHPTSLAEGKLSFRGTTIQDRDDKSFTTDKVPVEALAATRVAVKFTDSYQDTQPFDLAPYLDGTTIVSSTQQLRWTPAPEGQSLGGYLAINTPATKGFVGFAPGGKTFDLGDGYSITPAKGFAVILLSAQGPTDTLATAKAIVVTAMARGRNTGMEFNEAGNQVLNMGKPPPPARTRPGRPHRALCRHPRPARPRRQRRHRLP